MLKFSKISLRCKECRPPGRNDTSLFLDSKSKYLYTISGNFLGTPHHKLQIVTG
jgi:hypothetical protein